MPTSLHSPPRTSALAIGSEVPAGDFAFCVHSVFASALNLAPAGGRTLVTLVGADADEDPRGIRLATREPFDAWPVAPGSCGRREGDLLVFDGTPEGGPFAVSLAGAPVRVRRPLPHIDPHGATACAIWGECAFHLAGLQQERSSDLRLAAVLGLAAPEGAMGERLVMAARGLAEPVRRFDAAAAGRAAERLLGLGGGLTPAGDDLLAGLLAALACTAGEHGTARRFVTSFGAEIARRLGATNAISATFLDSALQGAFPGALAAFAAAFAADPVTPSGCSPRAALDRLCARGHSSGMDTATGFLFGLWLRTDEETRPYAASI